MHFRSFVRLWRISCKKQIVHYTFAVGESQADDAWSRVQWENRTFAFCFLFCLEVADLYSIYSVIILSLHMTMIVLSLFDWISCARVALQRAWIKVHAYYASEIDKYAIKVSQKNRDDVYHIGNVKDVSWLCWMLKTPRWFWQINSEPKTEDWIWISKIELMIWWSPCQDLSIAKKDRKWLDGERSWLFREYVRILRETKPKRFILENVASMPKEAKDIITAELWVEPIMIDASLVSAQSRKRLFRTNIPGVTLPEDKWILLKDILEDWNTTDLKSYCITANYQKMTKQNYEKWQWHQFLMTRWSHIFRRMKVCVSFCSMMMTRCKNLTIWNKRKYSQVDAYWMWTPSMSTRWLYGLNQ